MTFRLGWDRCLIYRGGLVLLRTTCPDSSSFLQCHVQSKNYTQGVAAAWA